MKFKTLYAQFIVPTMASAACMALLLGCGGASEEQDAPLAPINNQVVLTGLTMNGYLANALVWVDLRTNNTPDGFEPFAYTDNQGYFSYNPNTGVNYCESDKPSMQRFCLQTGAQTGDLVIKATKGIELLSGESFRSVLTTKTSVQQARDNLSALTDLGPRPQGDTRMWQTQLDKVQLKLSPLTSIQAYLPENVSLKTLIDNFGYSLSDKISDADIVSIDYIAGLEQSDADAATLFTVDVSVSRLVDVLTLNFNKATQTLDFGFDGLPISSADAVYEGLATALINYNADTAASFSQSQLSHRAIRTIATNSTTKTRLHTTTQNSQTYSFPVLSTISQASLFLQNTLLNNDMLSSLHTQSLQTVSNNLFLRQQLNDIAHAAFNHFEQSRVSGFTLNGLLALNHTVTLSSLTSPIAFLTNEEASASTVISAFLRNPDNRISDLLIANMAASSNPSQILTLNSPSIDLSVVLQDLSRIALNSTNSSDAQLALASLQNITDLGALALVETPDDSSFWAKRKLSLSGFQDGTEQGQVLAFFNGQSNDVSGELIMCIAYRNDANTSDNISGKLFDGTWSVIGNGTQNRLSLVAEGFTMQMKVLGESLGRDIAREQQVPSLPRMPNETYGKFGFTLNEDTSIWHSDDASINQSFGLLSTNTIPSNDSECKNLLSLTIP